jgi:hypothetical protein
LISVVLADAVPSRYSAATIIWICFQGAIITVACDENDPARRNAVAIAGGLVAVRNTWITFVASQNILGRSD